MEKIISYLNSAGNCFVDFAWPMLIQSSILIIILLGLDLVLRRKVRAVVRYGIWMLVLVKLVLPPSLTSPTGLGYWVADRLPEVAIEKVKELPAFQPMDTVVVPSLPPVGGYESRRSTEKSATGLPAAPPEIVHSTAMNWQSIVLAVWLVGVIVLAVLLLQRLIFVKGLISQSDDVGDPLSDALSQCSRQMAMRRRIILKLSPNAASPSVCGLFRPVILIPHGLVDKLTAPQLRAVLLHELAHIKRGDLWVSFIQTTLQILYFYNPLLWLANAIIRKVREQAVDEMVLVAMGSQAEDYPDTLLNVSKLTFRRPALSLRLIGVVESKSALKTRIKHIVTRPIPKSAKLGIVGLLAIAIAAAVLLPMAKATKADNDLDDMLIKFVAQEKGSPKKNVSQGKTMWVKNYDVEFAHGEKLLVFAELYEVEKPMRRLGQKIFTGSATPEKLSVKLFPVYKNDAKNIIAYTAVVELGEQTLEIPEFTISSSKWLNETGYGCYQGEGLRKSYGIKSLFTFYKENLDDKRNKFWVPESHATAVHMHHEIIFRMIPVSQAEYLILNDAPAAGRQGLDGKPIPPDLTWERAKQMNQKYKQSIRSMVVPLPKLTAHRYYKVGDPIQIEMKSVGAVDWKPALDEIFHDDKNDPFFVLINGKEYSASPSIGPFNGFTSWLVVPKDASKTPGKYRFAYGWKNLDVVNPEKPEEVIHFDRLITNEVEFEVVDELPDGYYQQVYEDGWEDVLHENIIARFADAWHLGGVAGTLLALNVKTLPFDIAFDIYAQAEGSQEEVYAGQIAFKTGSYTNYRQGIKVKGLTWDNVGDRRWRLILKPSQKVAASRPAIRHYYGREFVTDWLTFERSERFDNHRRMFDESNNSDPVTTNSNFTATLPNGVTVELLGVCEHPSEGKQWWRPDGSLLKVRPYAKLNDREAYNDLRMFEIVYHLIGPGKAISKIIRTDEMPGYFGPYDMKRDIEKAAPYSEDCVYNTPQKLGAK